MNKYRDKSDFEINKAVAEIIHPGKVFTHAYSFGDAYGNSVQWICGYAEYIHVDYCNNPADAWPIILKNKISIIIPGVEYSDGYSPTFAASGFDDVSHITRNTYYTDEESFNQNPLRAAMEVFLMMKEAENEKS